ncbi:MAG: hypothetical protein ACRCZ9_08475 [Fusobacteriaceae bacterium]
MTGKELDIIRDVEFALRVLIFNNETLENGDLAIITACHKKISRLIKTNKLEEN